MIVEERFVRVCPEHRRAAKSDRHGGLRCPAGPSGGHLVEAWKVFDRQREEVVGAGDAETASLSDAVGKKRVAMTGRATTPAPPATKDPKKAT